MKQDLMIITKHHVIFLLCLFGSILLMATFCQAASQEDVKKERREAATSIGNYSLGQKDKAIAEAKDLMKKLDQSMDDAESKMKENWHSLEESTKQNYELSKKEFHEDYLFLLTGFKNESRTNSKMLKIVIDLKIIT